MKKVIKIILFVLILFILVEFISCMLMPKESIKKYGLYKTAFYDILVEEKNSIDAVAIGDSLTYNSISPMEIWHKYGITTYDCAEAGQIISDSLEYLKIAIEHTHPKVVFIEGNVLFRDPNKKPNYVKARDALKKVLPIFKIHNGWKDITFSEGYTNVNITKGYKYNSKTKKGKKDGYMNESLKSDFPKGNIEYLKQMKELCDENNIKLVILTTPSQKTWNEKRHNNAAKIAKELDIEFIDLNIENPTKINWEKDTKDEGDHLNYKGALKVSDYVGKYLKETNLFDDKRQNKKYASWNNAYENYINSLDDVINNQ